MVPVLILICWGLGAASNLSNIVHINLQPEYNSSIQELLLIHIFLSTLQSLLCDPNPNSPANSEAARMFSENKRDYNRRVREVVEQSWTAD